MIDKHIGDLVEALANVRRRIRSSVRFEHRATLLCLIVVALAFLPVARHSINVGFAAPNYEIAKAKFLFIADQTISEEAVLSGLKEFSRENQFDIYSRRLPVKGWLSIRIDLESSDFGEFTIDNHLVRNEYIAYYFLRSHNPHDIEGTLSRFKDAFSKLGARLAEEKRN